MRQGCDKMMSGSEGPKITGPSDLMIMMSDMTNLQRSVIIDLIMVQLISLSVGAFLILAFQGYKLEAQQVTWVVVFLLVWFMFSGMVYRKLGD